MLNSLGQSDGSSYSLIPDEMGDEMLCLSSQISDTVQTVDGVIASQNNIQNSRMFYYKVLKCGAKVKDICGVVEGDYVFVDMLARFADTIPVSFINCRNVLFKTDVSGKEVIALPGHMIALCVEPTEEVNEFGLIQKVDVDPYAIVTSIDYGQYEERSVSVGDKIGIVLHDDAATYVIGSKKYFDFPITVPIFKYGN